MGQVIFRLLFWSLLFLLVATLPLWAAAIGSTPVSRGFWIEFGVGLGMVGFALLGLQFVTTSRFKWTAPYFGSDAMIQFHRETGIVATTFILAHPILLIFADPSYLEFFDPRVNFPRAVALSVVVVCVIGLVVLPLWRLSFGLSYEWWRITHGGLAALAVGIGLVHSLQVGHYVAGLAKQAVWIGGTALILAMLFQARVVKPLRMKRRPYRIVGVIPDCPDVYRLVVEPVGHPGMRFQSGQYAWITVGDTPFSLQQHPFSIASSDQNRDNLEFVIKELGDFTGSVKDLQPGTPVFLEGPYGAFTLDPAAEGFVMIMGGIGVTPALGHLRSMRDRNDKRPVLLLYANVNAQEVPLKEQLEEIANEINLEIVHILEEPPEGWEGESGFVTEEILSRRLEEWKQKDAQYFVCGPTPMMDMVEQGLRSLRTRFYRMHSERFEMV